MALQGMIHEIPRVDDTLTKEGQFADAKKVGDTLAVIQERLGNIDPHFARNVGYDSHIGEGAQGYDQNGHYAGGLAATNVHDALDEMVTGLYYPNLLINGDFRCNQRGKTSYAGVVDGVSNSLYTVDMWRSMGVNVAIGDGFISIANRDTVYHTFRQTVSGLADGVYTLSMLVRDVSGYSIMNPESSGGEGQFILPGYNKMTFEIGSGKHSNVIMLGLNPGSTLQIDWIRLDKGDRAHAHVAEPYDVALARCMKYLRVLDVMYSTIEFAYSDNRLVAVANFDKMAAKPSATIGKAMYYDVNWTYMEAAIASKHCENGALEVRTAASDKTPHASTNTLKLFDVILSCEPT